jgi:hypothetical protein
LIEDFDVPLIENYHKIGSNIQETLKILNLDENYEEEEEEKLANNNERDSQVRKMLSPMLKTKLI